MGETLPGPEDLGWLGVEAGEAPGGWDPGHGQGPDPPPVKETFPLLRDLLANPELLRAPEAVLPRCAYRGRAAGLIGPDKSGKSSIAGHGVAALTTGGRWLGEPLATGRAIVAALDEALGDTIARLDDAGAHPDRVRVLAIRPPDLLEALESVLRIQPADLVVVDSLAEWARLTLGQAPEDGDSSGWGSVVRPLVQLSRDYDVALLLLHHPRRSDGQYRGSGEIAAALDCLLEMSMPRAGEDSTLRRFRARARWPVDDWSLRLEGGRYVLAGGGELSIETRILLHVEAHPGATTTEIRQNVTGRAKAIADALERLEGRGAVQDLGSGGRHEWWPGGSGRKGSGTGAERDGNGFGNEDGREARSGPHPSGGGGPGTKEPLAAGGTATEEPNREEAEF